MKWEDGSSFEGHWEFDHRVRGSMYMLGGNIYEGSFKDDKFHGVGKMIYPDETVIQSYYSKGITNNIVRMEVDIGVYIGEFDMK